MQQTRAAKSVPRGIESKRRRRRGGEFRLNTIVLPRSLDFSTLVTLRTEPCRSDAMKRSRDWMQRKRTKRRQQHIDFRVCLSNGSHRDREETGREIWDSWKIRCDEMERENCAKQVEKIKINECSIAKKKNSLLKKISLNKSHIVILRNKISSKNTNAARYY